MDRHRATEDQIGCIVGADVSGERPLHTDKRCIGPELGGKLAIDTTIVRSGKCVRGIGPAAALEDVPSIS